jgi:hypothetical protein
MMGAVIEIYYNCIMGESEYSVVGYCPGKKGVKPASLPCHRLFNLGWLQWIEKNIIERTGEFQDI